MGSVVTDDLQIRGADGSRGAAGIEEGKAIGRSGTCRVNSLGS
jgi:hypothetical protein